MRVESFLNKPTKGLKNCTNFKENEVNPCSYLRAQIIFLTSRLNIFPKTDDDELRCTILVNARRTTFFHFSLNWLYNRDDFDDDIYTVLFSICILIFWSYLQYNWGFLPTHILHFLVFHSFPLSFEEI